VNTNKVGYKELLDQALARIETLSAQAALEMHGMSDVVFVDVRDPRELAREGCIPGAFRAPRGMLEFWIDPDSPYHKPIFAGAERFIFYCASGWRSALTTCTAREMGLERVAHIGGGFAAWRDVGGPVETAQGRAV